MKLVHSLSLALAIAAVGAPTLAAQDDQHQGHHPATAEAAAAPAAAAPAADAPPATVAPASAPVAAADAMSGTPTPDMARMDAQMKAMREMHSKMMAAKTPNERNALMAGHMKAMQDGMDTMNDMSTSGMGDMTMMKGMPERGMGDMKGNMAAHHQMMEKRMAMMQMMMQMMMDRLPPKSVE